MGASPFLLGLFFSTKPLMEKHLFFYLSSDFTQGILHHPPESEKTHQSEAMLGI